MILGKEGKPMREHKKGKLFAKGGGGGGPGKKRKI